jgi:hypothetical protein
MNKSIVAVLLAGSISLGGCATRTMDPTLESAGTGAAVGAAGGAAVGAMVGGISPIEGAAVGAVVGGLAGKGVAEQIDPTVEDAYWRDNYSSRPYASGASYDDFGPAYAYGVNSYSQYPGRSFDDVESDLSRGWDRTKGQSKLGWEKAKHASRDAWNRVSDSVERAIPGDSDGDGR